MLTVIFVTAAISEASYYSATNKASKAKPRLFEWSNCLLGIAIQGTSVPSIAVPGIAIQCTPISIRPFYKFIFNYR
jgi:hypothetical protein